MCILVQYLSPFDQKVKTKLLELLALSGTNCTANKIFEAFKTFFEKRKIPLKNIVAGK